MKPKTSAKKPGVPEKRGGQRVESESPELRDVLSRFFDLPDREQLQAFAEIKRHLGEGPWVDTEEERAIERRVQALAALEQAALHLRKRGELEADKAPTVKQFDQARRELGLEWGSTRVIRALGSWRNARRVLMGEKARESPAQERARIQAVKRNRTHEEPLHALRHWLQTNPEPASRTSYEAFAKERNASLPSGSRPLPSENAITTQLRLSWALAIEVARSKQSLVAAQEQHRNDLLTAVDDDEALIGASHVTALLGVRIQNVPKLVTRGRLAPPVARVGRMKAWVVKDVKACLDKQPPPKRQEGEWQNRVVDTEELARLLERHPDYLRALLSQKAWNRIPKPDGAVGQKHYWWRQGVEKWLSKAKSP